MASLDAVIANFFSKMDKDGDGTISIEEMESCLKLFDKDGNGSVSSTEWSDGFVSDLSGTSAQAEKMFHHLDKSGSGEITIQSLQDLFRSMDSDGNGKVSKDEFHDFCIKLLS